VWMRQWFLNFNLNDIVGCMKMYETMATKTIIDKPHK
jgi:hypothetical protein